jgi:hypothetical protein
MAVQTPVDPRKQSAVDPPDAGVIDDARARQRRQRRKGAFAVVAIIVLGVLAWFAFGGGDGNARRARPADDRGGSATARSSGSGAARVLASALLPRSTYALAVQDERIAVIGTEAVAGACETRMLDPQTLRVDSIVQRCTTGPALSRSATKLIVFFRPSGTAIRVATRGPLTRRVTVGPTLMTLPEWDWAHSGFAWGDGELWIYGLGDSTSTLLEVSASSGRLVHRFTVAAGPDPFMAVDADGFWISESAWGGSSCATACTLWHVAPGSARLVAARTLGIRTQWLIASGHSVYADVLTSAPAFGFHQTIWRLDGSQAHIAYMTPATLLPSTDFASGTGYVVVGNATAGYFTISQLGSGTTPNAVGGCDTAGPVRVVRIDPATGRQAYIATLPRNIAGSDLDCHLSADYPDQAVFDAGSLYLLAGQSSLINGNPAYQRVVRVTP